jgi:hypothetical protein
MENKTILPDDLTGKHIKEYGADQLAEGDLVKLEGRVYRVVKRDSGYTRQYYSHSTPEKGPGPGWDLRFDVLRVYGVEEAHELPDEPHYDLELEEV